LKPAQIALAAALVIGVGTCCLAIKPDAVAPKVVEVPPPVELPTGQLSQMLGINEAVSVPRRTLEREDPGEKAMRHMLESDVAYVKEVGTTWVRSHTAVPPFLHWQRWQRDPERAIADMDLWLDVVQAGELSPIIMLSPFSGNYTASTTGAYVVDDPESYAAYVTAVVERYDGDGVDDMPGLRAPVHTWEVDNEPDLKNTQVPRGRNVPRNFDPSTFCTPKEYAAVLVETSRLIRAADAEAVVLNGGFYRPMTRTARTYMEALFAEPGVLESFDVLSLHAYHSGQDMERFEQAIANGRELAPGKPIWVTETNVPSSPGNSSEPWVDEEYQGMMVVRTFVTALRLGVEKVFWHTLNDPPLQEGRQGPGMADHSLYRATSPGGPLERKPSGDAYLAVSRAFEGVSWDQVEVVPASGGEVVRIGERYIVVGGMVEVELPPVEVSRMVSGVSIGVESEGGALTLDASEGPLLLTKL
jgi:hypothetical protein